MGCSATNMSVSPYNEFIHGTGTGFNVTVWCVPSEPVKGYEMKVSFNPTVLQATAVYEGNIFSGYSTFYSSGVINNTAGTIINVYGLILGTGNVTEAGSLVIIHFNSLGLGGSAIHVYDEGVCNESTYVTLTETDGCRRVYGDYMPWDLNQDNHCNYLDVSGIVSNYLQSCEPGEYYWDIVSDGVCNYLEVSCIVSHFNNNFRNTYGIQ